MRIRYFTKGQLIRAAELGAKHDYDRQLVPEILDDLDDVRFPAWLLHVNRDRRGEPCAAHARLGVGIKLADEDAWRPIRAEIDVPRRCWAALPSMQVPELRVAGNREAWDVDAGASFSLRLECPPGEPRPGALIGDVLAGTGVGLDAKRPCETFFGCWTWEIPKEQADAYRRVRHIIADRVGQLYRAGIIRAGSW